MTEALLTTGTKSGLGRFLFERLGGLEWNRTIPDESVRQFKSDGVDTILHCAFNAAKVVTSESLFGYLSDNLLFTERLTRIPHRKFIFFSTVDVYPPNPETAAEEMEIDLSAVKNIYGVTKLMSEAIVKAQCANWLVLRCVSLLGPYSRRSSLIRILTESPCQLGLSPDSRMNVVLHQDIAELVSLAVRADLKGVFNVASSSPIRLGDAAKLFKREVEFGTCRYDAGDISNSKLCSVDTRFEKSSEQVVRMFASQSEFGRDAAVYC